jgi:hypothetical protein
VITETPTMIPVPIAERATMKRLTEVAADAAELADRRSDLELRELVDDLHRDLVAFQVGDDD